MSEIHPPTITRPNKKALLALSILVVAILSAGLYHARHNTAVVDATAHQPERYTELYYTDPTTLPVKVVHGTSLPVSVTVHNVEARSMNYTYDFSLLDSNGNVLTKTRQVFNLPSTDSKIVSSTFTVPKTYRGRVEVETTLVGLNQSVHFWVQVV